MILEGPGPPASQPPRAILSAHPQPAFTIWVARVCVFGNSRFTPYVQFLVGGVHRSQVMTGGSEGELIASPENSFAYTANGGVDLKLSHHFSVRLFQAGYLHTQFTPNQLGTGASNSQNDFTFATGIVIH